MSTCSVAGQRSVFTLKWQITEKDMRPLGPTPWKGVDARTSSPSFTFKLVEIKNVKKFNIVHDALKQSVHGFRLKKNWQDSEKSVLSQWTVKSEAFFCFVLIYFFWAVIIFSSCQEKLFWKPNVQRAEFYEFLIEPRWQAKHSTVTLHENI